MKIGCHLSSSGGYLAMGQTAVSIGANVFQFFTRNPRGGAAKPIDMADAAAFNDFAAANGIGPILAHAPYTLNAAGAEARVREFAEMTMADDLRRLEFTPGALYNFHPGSHVGRALRRVSNLSLICSSGFSIRSALFPLRRCFSRQWLEKAQRWGAHSRSLSQSSTAQIFRLVFALILAMSGMAATIS